ncbi:LPS export ABC transporter periplasmic protein LptC [Pseudodesulfovibrio piezophilus]|uniref:LPS export ABC transporter periplasmic protein LptC n=1 Tax=Pseudodesulfovibrio piezophilus (strain DSM 21447 / JCM 15486 / C1TLV30) TaxID=1322246 RepID=M1WLF8_PSEP2|nr:LPS export ABC transporter periplasmic protein LptC [Pseudodesulfovibrio piezophilus]CCH47790.1 conserved exported protein of unknown function [Pseudodesulfovibrio piezophilus C1TLV30]
MKRRSALFFILIFALGLLLGIAIKETFFTDILVTPEKASGGGSRDEILDQSDIVAQDIELVQGKQGAMTWKLLAKKAQYNQERKLIGVEHPQLTAFYGEDRQEVYVKADLGDVDQSNDNLTLYDNVTGRFGDIELLAQHLDYVGAMHKVYLKGGVIVRRPDMTLTGAAVEIDLISRELIAAGGVEALFSPQKYSGMSLNK